MTIVDTTKLAIGIVFLIVGVGAFLLSRGTKGFGQRRQAAALALIGGLAFIALGLGLIEL